jgi:dimethylamine monooxygenase subunit C
MLVTGIKSKPVYAPLRADPRGRYHLMLGLGVGEVALLRVLREMQESAHEGLARTRVLLIPAPAEGDPSSPAGASGAAASAREVRPAEAQREIESLPLQEVRTFPDGASLLGEFKSLLADSLMGTRLYVAGPESFIGLAMKIALEFNLNKDEIRAEELGSLARRVYCIHCRTTAENVRTNIVRCLGCGRWLLVRDHYSRRLAAYMGVMVDAEAPGELPPIKDVFV